jgi:hypothetical protein
MMTAGIKGLHILFKGDYKFKEEVIVKGKFSDKRSTTKLEPLNSQLVVFVNVVKGCAIRLG